MKLHHLKITVLLVTSWLESLKKYILLLTATPVENNLEETVQPDHLLLPGQLETASSFKRKYITRRSLKTQNTEELKVGSRGNDPQLTQRNRSYPVCCRAEVIEVLSPKR